MPARQGQPTALTLASFDVRAWAESRGARAASDSELTMMCPRCHKADKLCLHADKQVWHCWVCQQESGGAPRVGRGHLIDLIALVDGVDRRTAARQVESLVQNAPPPAVLQPLALRSRPPIWSLPMAWPAGTAPIGPNDADALAFLAGRRITAADVVAYRLRHGRTGRLRGRLVVPVFERDRMVYYQARAMWQPGAGEPFAKSLNPTRFEAGGTTAAKVLLNLDRARAFKEVLVVEGPIDAIVAGPHAVATFGKTISDHQIVKLREAGVRRLVLCWDGPGPTEPEGAWPAMLKAAPRLAALFEVRLARLPEGDPASVPAAVLAQAVAQAARWPLRRSPGRALLPLESH